LTEDKSVAAESAHQLWLKLQTLPGKKRSVPVVDYVEDQHKGRLRVADFSCSFSGIYFLCVGLTCIYVGRSRCVARRIADHLSDKSFDNAYCIRCKDEAEAAAMERKYIIAIRPYHNVMGNPNKKQQQLSVCDLEVEAA
jgi:hypothetical protein